MTYTGFLSKDHVTSFYKIADIVIAPSVYDHCPYTVLEMMASRIPLIVSRINGLDELLSDDHCDVLVPVDRDYKLILPYCRELLFFLQEQAGNG